MHRRLRGTGSRRRHVGLRACVGLWQDAHGWIMAPGVLGAAGFPAAWKRCVLVQTPSDPNVHFLLADRLCDTLVFPYSA